MGEDFKRKFFVNRELSWLEFNRRVLFEAFDEENPLFERLKFISIYFSNLDEFFMVRVGSLTDQKEAKIEKLDDKTGWNIEQQISEIYKQVRELSPLARDAYFKTVEDLKEENVDIIDFGDMSKVERLITEKYFEEDIKPILSPQIVDRNHPFPFLQNKDILVLTVMETKHGNVKIGIVPINNIEPILVFNVDNRKKVVFVADMVSYYAHKLFYKFETKEVCCLRITRNMDISIDEAFLDNDNDIDFRGIMQKVLKRRKLLAPVRVQMSCEVSEKTQRYICEKLGVYPSLIFVEEIPLDFSFGFSIHKKLGIDNKNLFFRENKPVKALNVIKGDWIKYIDENDVLLNFPFQSIQSFVELLYEAADSPSVLSIKISLYRLANHSKIVAALAYAAERGKDVLCVLELRARFDEQNNIDYSKVLQDAGCTVIYGLDDYKVHAKLCVITKKHHGNISYITQVGTGNYNEKTSEQYTDMSFITSDYNIGVDANSMFKSLCLGEVVEKTNSLWIAPNCFKTKLLDMIDMEIQNQKLNGDGFISIKVNSLNDIDIMNKFIEASVAGVDIELFVRGICCICPNVKGYTEKIKIKSIVGKYLEHSRIFCFGKNGRESVFIGSGDLLNRNTRRRVEVFAPVKSAEAKKNALMILEACRKDNRKGWIMQSDGKYIKDTPKNGESFGSQRFLENYFSENRTEVYKKKSIFDIIKGSISRLIDK